MTLWRLARRIHAAKQALARGARLAGGRWNPPGMPVVYAGSTVALVALEYFVHLSGDEPADLVLLRVQVPEGASVDTIPSARLPESWQAELGLTQRLGREWIESRRTLVLTVPCAIVPEESNALVNPSHPEWNDVETAVMRAFHFDRRMYRS